MRAFRPMGVAVALSMAGVSPGTRIHLRAAQAGAAPFDASRTLAVAQAPGSPLPSEPAHAFGGDTTAPTTSPSREDSAEGARSARALAMKDALDRHRLLLAEYLRSQLDSVALLRSQSQDAASLRRAAARLEADRDLAARLPGEQFDSAEKAVKAYLAEPSPARFAAATSRATEYLSALNELLGLAAWKERVLPSLDERFRVAARELAALVK